MSDQQNQPDAREASRQAADRLHHLSMRYAGALVELAQGKPVGLLPKGYPASSRPATSST